jgi:hypothetical protein
MSLRDILSNLANGDYDGERIDNEESGVSWGFYIDRGTPVQYREGKSSKFFNGKENERIPGTRTEERFVTDEKKDTFFKKYGYLRSMFDNHPEVMDYSHKYYEKRKKKK